MAGNAWGESWGIVDSFAWGDSWGFEGFVPPVVTPPAPPAVDQGGVGGFSQAWRDHYRKKLPKKKRTLLEELDEMIVEARERIAEAPPSVDEHAHERSLRVSQALANREDIDTVTNERIAAQIAILKRTIEEIDDEEIILLALH